MKVTATLGALSLLAALHNFAQPCDPHWKGWDHETAWHPGVHNGSSPAEINAALMWNPDGPGPKPPLGPPSAPA